MGYGHNHIKRPDIALVILLSLLFHFFVISAALFITSRPSSRTPMRYKFYEVALVELPSKRPEKKTKKKAKRAISYKRKKGKKGRKRIVSRKKEKSIVIPKKRIRIHNKRKSPDKIIEEAISKIKKRVKTSRKRREKDHIEEAINKIKEKIGKEERGSPRSSKVIESISLQLYKGQIESRITNNWIYPAALIMGTEKRDLEAIIVLKVKKSGEIIRFWFKKRSNDAIFDNSLIKAIKRSNPLPPFPEGYKKRYEEIEIHFSLSELMAS